MTNEPYIDKFERRAKLLDKWPLGASTIPAKSKVLAGELRSKGRLHTNPAKKLI